MSRLDKGPPRGRGRMDRVGEVEHSVPLIRGQRLMACCREEVLDTARRRTPSAIRHANQTAHRTRCRRPAHSCSGVPSSMAKNPTAMNSTSTTIPVYIV